ncbi:MAG: hypothetical protein Q4F34_06395 [Prevotellaceae bacterium]|nr:hypothetical protein [Prevotellaceae bacterium]
MKIFLFSVIIIAFVVLLLSVKVIFSKNGRFPNFHIDGSKAMKDRNIHCVIKEDRLLRQKKKKNTRIINN